MGRPVRSVTFRLGVEFDGAGFHGWQAQPRDRTVQGELEGALERIVGSRVRVSGAGRTDAGCHAAGQVASVSLATRLSAERLRAALNAHLPEDVRIVDAAEAGAAFHARRSAMRRAYRYLIVPRATAIRRRYAWARPVRAGLDALNDAARPLLGSHDFTALSKQSTDQRDARCEVYRAAWSGRGGRLRFDIVADRFLYTMVRRIVSTVIRAAEEGGGARTVRAVLESRDRRGAAPPAPAHGLYLMGVRYPGVGWIPKERLHVAV